MPDNLYAVFVKYPFRDEWSFGASCNDLETAMQRLADHGAMYSMHPTGVPDTRAEAYILDVSAKRVCIEFCGIVSRGDSELLNRYSELLAERHNYQNT